MRRRVVLVGAVLFLAMLAVLTVVDAATYGITPLDVLSLIILAFLLIGILGALTQRTPPP